MTRDEYEPVIKQAEDEPYGEFTLEMGDGREFDLDVKIKHHTSFAAIDSMYGPFPVIKNINKIPIEIAVEGNAALATYLVLALETHRNMMWGPQLRTVADMIGVERYTVTKYLGRVRNRL